MSRLLPYETILKAREGDPEAVNAVLLHYAGLYPLFLKSERAGQRRGGGLCKAAVN